MKMDAISHIAPWNVDKKDLGGLIEVFGSEFSLEDISSAYFRANCDQNLASEVLCEMHGSTSTAATTDNSEPENAISLRLTSGGDSTRAVPSELLYDNVLPIAPAGEKKPRVSKKYSAAMGTVSGVIGKEYAKSRPVTHHHSVEARKPLKLDSKDFLASKVCSEKNVSSMSARKCSMQADTEEFLFKMLGDGFQLDMTVIQEVLGLCGYNIQKSIDKLLDLSASTLEKSDDVVRATAEEESSSNFFQQSNRKYSGQKSLALQEHRQQLYFSQSEYSGSMEENSTDSLERESNGFGIEKEILHSLFDLPDRSVEAPKKTRLVREVRRSRAFDKPVIEPLRDSHRESKPSAAKPQSDTREEAEGDENNYEVLRKAVKEYWITMKEYYKAAADAFAEGDHARADKLMDKAQFFNQKAREFDEKSFQKLMMKTRDDEIVSLDLQGFEPKEALRSLRIHLPCVSGIPSIKYLRIIIEIDEDTTKGKRKRLIMKQLEKESIKWTDERNGQAMLIQVDVIDPKHLSFAKK